MHIFLNDQEIEFASSMTVGDLLIQQQYAEQRVAVAINGTFVPRDTRDGRQLQDGDRVDVVAPMQGG